MRNRIITPLLAVMVALAAFCGPALSIPVDAAPATVEHVATHVGATLGEAASMPTHNETTLSLFSCAATRPSGFGSANVLHSHRVAASSTVDLFGQPEIDAFDCEVQNGGGGGPEAIYRTIYVYGNVDDGTNGGSTDKGIIGPLNVIRF
jgi:hypothetical protein